MYSENNTKADILARMKNNIANDIDKNEGSLIYDSITPNAAELEKIYENLDGISGKFDIYNLSDSELEIRIYQRSGIERKAATYATGILTATGTGTINTGVLFQTSAGVQFESVETVTIKGSGTINVKAVLPGKMGNIPTGQITVIPVVISGITSVTNNDITSGGYDKESNSALIQRYLDKVQAPSTSGNKAQFKSWAESVTGVGMAKVFPLWNGNNTVGIVIIDSNKQPASDALVANVQNYIDPGVTGLGNGAAPIGAFCTIQSAMGKTIDVSFTAVKDTNYTDAQRQTSVETNLTNYFKSIAFTNAAISYAQIGAIVLDSGGILDYSNLTINSGTSNISLTESEVPVKGVVTIA